MRCNYCNQEMNIAEEPITKDRLMFLFKNTAVLSEGVMLWNRETRSKEKFCKIVFPCHYNWKAENVWGKEYKLEHLFEIQPEKKSTLYDVLHETIPQCWENDKAIEIVDKHKWELEQTKYKSY